MRRLVAILFFVMSMGFSLSAANNVTFVNVPVASAWVNAGIKIRAKGYELPLMHKDIPQHDTQLLYGERVKVLESKGSGWCKVRCLEQPYYNRKTGEWRFCNAWMLKKYLQSNGYDKAPDFVVTELWTDVHVKPSAKSEVVQRFSFGTLVSIVKHDDDWSTINLLNGSVGFVKNSDLYNFSKPEVSQLQLRERIIKHARKFLGLPYCWAGRSAYSKNTNNIPTSVDCSGLVSLAYRACGFNVPRNSHSQSVKATPVEPKNMKIGDLIFFKEEDHKFERVSHVMIYAGGEEFIEANGPAKNVRVVTAQECFGVSFDQLKNGGRFGAPDDQIEIHCGSFLSNMQLRDELRIK